MCVNTDRKWLGPAVPLGLGDGPRRVDQADVTEGLRQVPELFACRAVELLGQEAEVVPTVHSPLEGDAGTVYDPCQGLRVRQPESAEDECPFGAGKPSSPR